VLVYFTKFIISLIAPYSGLIKPVIVSVIEAHIDIPTIKNNINDIIRLPIKLK
jgi:hypothetical protein